MSEFNSNVNMKCFCLVIIAVIALSQGTEAAKCAFYGSAGETGSQTANGEAYNSNALTCATLPHLPMGSVLQVTNQRTGKSLTVRVNDRIGGGSAEDTIDLTYGAFGMLAAHDDGIFPCSYDIL